MHDGSGIFSGLPSPLRGARYHSLVIARPTLPPVLRVTASAGDDGEIMSVEHRVHPVIGVQFHPESAATERGYALIDRFLHGENSHPDRLPPLADGAHDAPSTPEIFVPPPVELVR
jgi:anthranilate/para-aminobenzoate synthase component II